MKLYLKMIAAGACALALAQTASATTQVRIGVYSGAPVQYRPVQTYYAPAPAYYVAAPAYVEPAWRGGYDWRARREARLRREEWRREHWRREHRGHEYRDHEYRDHERHWEGR